MRVERSLEGQIAKPNPLGDPLNELSDNGVYDYNAIGYSRRQIEGVSGGIFPQLEAAAVHGGKKSRSRIQSQGEQEWIERLVAKWGNDFGGMCRDRRLNPQQQSEGDLRKRVRKWEEGRTEVGLSGL